MTTNNRMELQAVIEGLQALKRRARVQVVTDSSYVKNGMEGWVGRLESQELDAQDFGRPETGEEC